MSDNIAKPLLARPQRPVVSYLCRYRCAAAAIRIWLRLAAKLRQLFHCHINIADFVPGGFSDYAVLRQLKIFWKAFTVCMVVPQVRFTVCWPIMG